MGTIYRSKLKAQLEAGKRNRKLNLVQIHWIVKDLDGNGFLLTQEQ